MNKQLRNIDSILRYRSPFEINAMVILMVAIISAAAYFLGYEITTSTFFIIPIALATGYGGYRQGVFYAFLCALIWYLIDTIFASHLYSHPWIPYWNTAVRLALFLTTAASIAVLKLQLNDEKSLSRTDSLTGVMNVRGFAEAAEKMFELGARHGRPTCLAYIDVDDFKKINDQLGHREGDKVLQTVGSIFISSMRKTDVVCRLGGDEFAIALPETNESGAVAAFNKLRTNLAHAMHENNWPVGFSIGVISFDKPPFNFDEAVKIADALMYKVKKSGKNNVLIEHFPAENNNSAEFRRNANAILSY